MTQIELGPTTLNLIRSATHANWVVPLISAFAGAFFAFIFIKFSESLSRISDRKRLNYNTLVQLDYLGNENLSIASSIIFVAKDTIKSINKSLETKVVNVNFNSFDSLIIKQDLLTNLLNIDFINEIFSLNINARKINHSFEAVSKVYDQINNGFFEQTTSLDVYVANLPFIIESLDRLIIFVEDFISANKNMIATARILQKEEKPIFTKLTKFIFKTKSLTDLKPKIDEKKEELEQQIVDISTKDQKRIEKLSSTSKS